MMQIASLGLPHTCTVRKMKCNNNNNGHALESKRTERTRDVRDFKVHLHASIDLLNNSHRLNGERTREKDALEFAAFSVHYVHYLSLSFSRPVCSCMHVCLGSAVFGSSKHA
jgi:hypothetical protein